MTRIGKPVEGGDPIRVRNAILCFHPVGTLLSQSTCADGTDLPPIDGVGQHAFGRRDDAKTLRRSRSGRTLTRWTCVRCRENGVMRTATTARHRY
ncbi:hypothetical protein FWK35_00037199 [Aphis craccivora]|uniref:Uncharacterized protein n=1 Tax=Aphis craccivora TaxID=307492 RepID=A0A6G0W871_APHCR|nr:hypothetical protein FWK35_00037199 [Aphis craccivora]